MKKIITLILAFVLSCVSIVSGIATLAESNSTEKGEVVSGNEILTRQTNIDIDRDMLQLLLATMGKDEAFIMKADTLAAVLTEASDRLTLDDTGFQWDLMLGGKVVLTIAGGMDDEEDNFILGSNLIPSYRFSLSTDEMDSLLKEQFDKQNRKTRKAVSGLSRIDLDALGRAINPYINEFINSVSAAMKNGEAEQGSYVQDGVSYSTMTPIDVDMVAVGNAWNQLKKDLAADATVAVTMAQIGSTSSGKTDKPIDPAKMPTVSMEQYTGAGDTTYTAFTVENPPSSKKANAPLMTGFYVTKRSGEEGEASTLTKAEIAFKEMRIGLVSEKEGELDIYYMDPQKKLIGLRTTISDEGERTFDLSQGTIVTRADAKEKKDDLSADAMKGLASISTAAMEALPEEVTAALALISLEQKKK